MADRPATLIELAEELKLPAKWLRIEALAGRIPCLKIGRRLLFNIVMVRQALSDRAGTEVAPCAK